MRVRTTSGQLWNLTSYSASLIGGWPTNELARILDVKCQGQDANHAHRPVEGQDAKQSGSYTAELPERIMQSLGHADVLFAYMSISHAAGYIWDEWAAATPGKRFLEDIRDDFEFLNIPSDVLDVCITKYDCCGDATSDTELFDVNYIGLHPSIGFWGAALNEAETLTTEAEAEAPLLFYLGREACNWEISSIQLSAIPKARRVIAC